MLLIFFSEHIYCKESEFGENMHQRVLPMPILGDHVFPGGKNSRLVGVVMPSVADHGSLILHLPRLKLSLPIAQLHFYQLQRHQTLPTNVYGS